MQRFVLALVLAATSTIAFAQVADIQNDGAQPPLSAPQPDKSVRDPDFGVTARHFGLERRVEMYQWRSQGEGYVLAWSDQPIDSSGFPTGHDNPPFPLEGKRWLAGSVSIDGRPLDAAVLETLGEWRAFRPSFNALPGNLAATFQPQGDGLGSAENPLDPQLGDLRITWRDLVLPPVQDAIVLRDGRWRLRAQTLSNAGDESSKDSVASQAEPDPSRVPWVLGGSALAALIAALVVLRRRKR